MKRNKKIKIIFLSIIILSGTALYTYFIYENIFKPNIKKNTIILIPSGSDFDDLLDTLNENNVVIDINSFIKTAEIKKYKNKIRSRKIRA